MTLATLLKNARIKWGHSLRSAADGSGVSNPMISQIENGKIKNPGIFTVLKLARVYRLNPLDIFSKTKWFTSTNKGTASDPQKTEA